MHAATTGRPALEATLRALSSCNSLQGWLTCTFTAYPLLDLSETGIASAFPGGSDGKESASNAGNRGSITGQRDPLEKGMATHSSLLA